MDAPQSRLDQVKAALPGTAAEIMAKSKLSRTTVWRWLKELVETGECHITPEWHRTPGGGPFVPTYAAGPGVNAACKLKPFTEAQKSARYRRAARKDGRWEDRNAKVRARWAADHARFTKDPLLAALFKPQSSQ
ncbi:MAG: hypothetical protein WKG03_14150 [Telluria sp.]